MSRYRSDDLKIKRAPIEEIHYGARQAVRIPIGHGLFAEKLARLNVGVL
jgi:hypothetical protein